MSIDWWIGAHNWEKISQRDFFPFYVPKKIPEWVQKSKFKDTSEWKYSFSENKLSLKDKKMKYFTYSQLFDIKKGKRIVVSKLSKVGNCPFVSSIEKNNGISDKLDILPNHKENTITVNYDGSVGEAFYQSEPYWALDSVNVLYPKFKLNSFIAMFLITLIRKEKYRFNYGRKWHKERMKESLIKLPIDKHEHPDWDFMENYIKGLKYSKELAKISIP